MFFDTFEQVAEILARIRVALHLQNLPACGNAPNYLLNLTEPPKPCEELKRKLVHEALKDSKGYYSQLEGSMIEDFINRHEQYKKES